MQCRHNLNYWQFGDYLGIGAGAHGKISYPDRIERTVCRRHPNDYLALMQSQPSEAVERKTVAAEDLPFEFMMNALRLTAAYPPLCCRNAQAYPPLKSWRKSKRQGKKVCWKPTRPYSARPNGDGCF